MSLFFSTNNINLLFLKHSIVDYFVFFFLSSIQCLTKLSLKRKKFTRTKKQNTTLKLFYIKKNLINRYNKIIKIMLISKMSFCDLKVKNFTKFSYRKILKSWQNIQHNSKNSNQLIINLTYNKRI